MKPVLRSRFAAAAVLLAAVLTVGCGNSADSGGKQSGGSGNPGEKDADRSQAIPLSGKEILRAFRDNPVAGNLKYEGKWLKITGGTTVVVAEKSFQIFIKDANAFVEITCHYDKATRPAVAKLLNNQKVTVIGRLREESGSFNGVSVSLTLDNCQFEAP